MEFQNFNLCVLPGLEKEGYVYLYGDIVTEYTVVLMNKNELPCDCTLTIDGRTIGKYRINADDSINIKGTDRKFTFIPDGINNDEAKALVTSNKDLKGLIKAEFKLGYLPEVKQNLDVYLEDVVTRSGRKSAGSGQCAGGTVEGEMNTQRFSTVKDLIYTGQVSIIYLRLVGDSRRKYRNLHEQSTPVPKPIF